MKTYKQAIKDTKEKIEQEQQAKIDKENEIRDKNLEYAKKNEYALVNKALEGFDKAVETAIRCQDKKIVIHAYKGWGSDAKHIANIISEQLKNFGYTTTIEHKQYEIRYCDEMAPTKEYSTEVHVIL